MNSLILRTATSFLLPLLLLFSVFLLLRGHNEPGGGFAGGLMAAAAVILHALAFDVSQARTILPIPPGPLIGVGLLCAAASGVVPMFLGRPFMTGLWTEVAGVELGTPLLFDTGVYLVVIGFATLILLTLGEES